ncbi:MAG: hypothetical protein D6677_09740 [Calditrichaeota bacterium]|nr:MAG: hypothetical protein D6677_09740 [Calditrichota bacterium]
MTFYYNYKDLLKSPRLALGPQRIFLSTLSVALAHIVYFTGSHAALLWDGRDFMSTWRMYGLLPWPVMEGLSTGPHILAVSTLVISALIILLGNTTLARSAYMTLRRNYFYTSRQAVEFVRSKATSVVGVYLTYFFLIAPFILGALGMAVIGTVYGIGDIINALGTLVYIFAGLILLFLTLSMIISFFLAPAIIAAREEDGFGTAVECMRLLWGEPWRLITYGILTVVLALIFTIAFAFAIKVGLIIYSILFLPLMHSLAPLLDTALAWLQQSMGGLDALLRSLLGEKGARLLYLKKHYEPIALPLSRQIAATIIYFFLMITGYMTVGYALSLINSALVTSIVIFDSHLNQSDLLNRADSQIDSGEFEFNPRENTKNLSDKTT